MKNKTILLGVILLASSSGMVLAQAPPDAPEKSIPQLIEEANRLAKNPQQSAAALAKFRELVEKHQQNEKLFNAALREYTNLLEEDGQAEQALDVMYQLFSAETTQSRYRFLTDNMERYQQKYPDAYKSFVEKVEQSRKRPGPPPPITPSKSLLSEILQRDDPERRDVAIEKLKELLAAGSPEQAQLSGLSTLVKALTAKFAHDEFYSLVKPLLTSKNAQIRRLALACLPSVGATSSDLPAMALLAEDESIHVRQEVGGALVRLGAGKHSEVVIPALMKLMQDPEHEVIKSTIRSMWGQYQSPKYDRFLVDLSYDPKYEYIVVYHCLSTMPSKSKIVCERLVEILDATDWNSSGRAAWGLTYGVVPEANELVETAILKALPEETNDYTRRQEFTVLKQVASERSKEYLNSVIELDLETEKFKELAKQVLAKIESTQN